MSDKNLLVDEKNKETILPHKNSNQNKIKKKITLIQQIITNQGGFKICFYHSLIFITYNININHLYFGYFVKQIGLIQSIIILLLIGIFSYLFQIILIEKLEKNNEDTLSAMFQENFGNFCSIVFEIICFLWILFNFLIFFLSYFRFFISTKIILSNFDEKNFYFSEHWIFSILAIVIFIILFLIINILENSSIIDINIILNVILDIVSLVLIIITLSNGIKLNQSNNPFWQKDINIGEMPKAICIFSSSFNNILVLFSVNKRLKLSLYPILEHRNILWINLILIFIYYSVFIFQGYYDIFQSQNHQHLLSIIIDYIIEKKKLDKYLFFILGGNLLSQILNINFYLYTIKKSILRNKIQIQSNKYITYMLTILVLIIFTAFGEFCYFNNFSSYNLTIINDSSFGFLMNFLFPVLFILKYNINISIGFLLLFIFFICSICLISLYERIEEIFLPLLKIR